MNVQHINNEKMFDYFNKQMIHITESIIKIIKHILDCDYSSLPNDDEFNESVKLLIVLEKQITFTLNVSAKKNIFFNKFQIIENHLKKIYKEYDNHETKEYDNHETKEYDNHEKVDEELRAGRGIDLYFRFENCENWKYEFIKHVLFLSENYRHQNTINVLQVS
jgi:hypothetical protein